MSIKDYAAIRLWCLDALASLAPDLPAEFVGRRTDTIERHGKKASILEVAKDLAEGLSHLPNNRRLAANEGLKNRHGFGFDYFTGRNEKHLARMIANGAIQTDAEYRAALDALSDTTIEPSLASKLQELVLERERQLGAT
jgi:hypothetical protein